MHRTTEPAQDAPESSTMRKHSAELAKLRRTIEETNRASTFLRLMQDDESVTEWKAWCTWLRVQG